MCDLEFVPFKFVCVILKLLWAKKCRHRVHQLELIKEKIRIFEFIDMEKEKNQEKWFFWHKEIKKEMRIKNQEIEIKNSFLQGNRAFFLRQHWIHFVS